ncbi:50S ribosomal protein L18 [bacterium]|nr:50S ribosomal protein L18 [bacterium]|tara:strand:- start:3141 stop:3494 length:354 start_codon:yes stop_codon:yes gene_type:complete
MTNKSQQKTAARTARHARIRARVKGTAERPRLAVYRSNKFLYAQLINDAEAKTIAAADTRASKAKTPAERAVELGKSIADAAKKAKVEAVVFDRGGFLFAGTIKAFADSARENGLTF